MDLNTYLKENVNDPKKVSKTVSFYEKFDQLTKLYDTIVSENQKLLRAQGKYNSRICFIFKDEEHFKECNDAIQRILPVYNISIWDICTLFLRKTEDDNENLNILLKELFIIEPSVIYIYDNVSLSKQIISESKTMGVINAKMISVNNIHETLDKEVPSKIFDLFKYLFTYNY